MKKKLLAMLKTKEDARAALVAKSEKSEDIAELRSIHAQLESINAEIAELRSLIDDVDSNDDGAGDDGIAARTKAVNGAEEQPEPRSYQPGRGFTPVPGGNPAAEERIKQDAESREKRGKDLMEGRAVTVASSSIVLPKHSSDTINPTFNVVSSLVDGVDRMVLPGGESFVQPYEKNTPAGDYTAEGNPYPTADVEFGYANIIKAKIAAYSETTEEVKKLPAADYERVIMNGISKSVRRKLAKEILVGDGQTNHLTGIFTSTTIETSTDIEIAAITNTTLNEIIFSYGGDEEVEDQAVLILNKADLKAFSQLRTTDGKPFHSIVTNGNTGTIDGIPFIINSACKAVSAASTTAGSYCMAYGPLSNYKLVIFSDLDVQRSTDYKFKEGMIAHRGSIFAGGNVVAYNGFLRIKKAAQA